MSDSSHSVRIATERLILKTLDEKSVDVVLTYYLKNRVFLAPWEPLRNEGFYTSDVQSVSLKLDREAQIRGDMIRFWIFLKDSDEILGTVSFTNIIRGVLKSCYLGYKISQDHTGKGYMSEAVAAAITYAFKSLKLHRIEANIMPKNVASLKLDRKSVV